jgi:pilus assembly protein Flp/PilA
LKTNSGDPRSLREGEKKRLKSVAWRVKVKGFCTMAILARFLKNEDGATAIEYALIGCFIALVIVGALELVGTKVSTVFTEVGAPLN